MSRPKSIFEGFGNRKSQSARNRNKIDSTETKTETVKRHGQLPQLKLHDIQQKRLQLLPIEYNDTGSPIYAEVKKDKKSKSKADIHAECRIENRPLSYHENDMKFNQNNNFKDIDIYSNIDETKILRENRLHRNNTISSVDYKNKRKTEIEKLEKIIKELKMEIHELKEENNELKKILSTTDKGDTIRKLEKEKSVKSKGGFFGIFRSSSSKPKIESKSNKNTSTDTGTKSKKKIQKSACFGNSLENIKKDDLHKLPIILVSCIGMIESNEVFMQANGIYRVSGNFSTVQKLKTLVNNHKYYKIQDQKDPHVVANLLKLFLRELKEPLVSYAFLEDHVPGWTTITQDTDEVKIYKIKQMIFSLPAINLRTLKFIIRHLDQIQQRSYDNHMDAECLAIVLGACIFYDVSQKSDIEHMESALIPSIIVKFMITYFDRFFETEV